MIVKIFSTELPKVGGIAVEQLNIPRKKNFALTERGPEVLKQCLVKESEIYEDNLKEIDGESLEVYSEVLSRIQTNSKPQ